MGRNEGQAIFPGKAVLANGNEGWVALLLFKSVSPLHCEL
jgi:hypothetical protein